MRPKPIAGEVAPEVNKAEALPKSYYQEELILAVPEKIKPNLFGQSDNPFLQIFRNAYDRIQEIYEPWLIPFINREHPARFERMEAIRKELDRLYSIQGLAPAAGQFGIQTL